MSCKILRFWPLVAMLFAGIMVSCSDDDPVVETGGENRIVVTYVSTAPDTADIVNDDVWDNVAVSSIRAGLKEIYADQFGPKVIRTQAVSDNEYIYFRFNWTDDSESNKPGYWSYHTTDVPWTQNGIEIIRTDIDTTWDSTQTPPVVVAIDTTADTLYSEVVNLLNPRWEKEDIFSMIWDNGSNGAEGANCATMCHRVGGLDTMYLTGGGYVDLWVWRAGRTDPLGLADDMLWDTDTRNYDDFSQNRASWQRNSRNQSQEESDPKWSHRDGKDYHGTFLFTEDTVTLDFATLVEWRDGDGVPGYILEKDLKPSEAAKTSRYDVKARSEFDPGSGTWTLVLWRKLNTGNDDDFVFTEGESYTTTLAIMDHTDNFHSGSEPITVVF